MVTVLAGKQGSGKTLWAFGYGYKNRKKVNVFTNMPLVGAFVLPNNWYDFQYPVDSILIIDEAQLQYNCRSYSIKEKQAEQSKILEYLTMCRHYQIDIIFITQSLKRLDVQIRELATTVIRISSTFKIPYLSIKEKKLKFNFLPILQRGRYFEDSQELEAYLNNVPGWDELRKKIFKIYSSSCFE